MIDRWENRVEPGPGQGKLYWHILFGEDAQVGTLASLCQQKLSNFPDLHFTPRRWLHLTVLTIGLANSFPPEIVETMITEARDSISGLSPIPITLRRILYHPEAIVIKVDPDGVLEPVRDAVNRATHIAAERVRVQVNSDTWVPHITLAYSTARQPASPIIAALGQEIPEHRAYIRSVSLVNQEGGERLWTWHSMADIQLENKSHIN